MSNSSQDIQSVDIRALLIEGNFQLLFDVSPVPAAVLQLPPALHMHQSTGALGGFVYANRAFLELTGYERDDIQTKSLKELIHPDQHTELLQALQTLIVAPKSSCRLEQRLLAKGPLELSVETHLRALLTEIESLGPCLVAQFHDVSAHRQREHELFTLATHDFLTGLPNRRRFEEELATQAGRVRRYRHDAALLIIDLDNFKGVNDAGGHRAGDDVLRQVANLARVRLRETDTVARLGGDEFAVILPEIDIPGARKVAFDLVEAIRQHVHPEGSETPVTASIGIAAIRGIDELDCAELIDAADRAMYAAKRAGCNCAAVAEGVKDQSSAVSSQTA